jgi:hypothetical protein
MGAAPTALQPSEAVRYNEEQRRPHGLLVPK